MDLKNQFKISAAYQWANSKSDSTNSEKAIKKIAEMINNRFSNNENGKHNYNVNFRRLRASAGRTLILPGLILMSLLKLELLLLYLKSMPIYQYIL